MRHHSITIASALALLACVGPAPNAAAGAPPSIYTSSLDKVIHLVGASGGVLSTTLGQYTVTVRDLANNPIPNSRIDLDFSPCGSADVHIASAQLEAGVTTSCGPSVVSGLTDQFGSITFQVMGNSQNPGGGAPGIALPCLRVTADGVLLDPQHTGAFAGIEAVIVAPYDETGTDGFTVVDVASAVGDLFHVPATYFARSDFNGDGTVTALDLAKQVNALFSGAWTATAADCP